jgi:hypothetical protein
VQQRRLAGARRRHQRHRLAGPNREVATFQDFQDRVALMVAPLDLMQKDDRCFGFGHRLAHS